MLKMLLPLLAILSITVCQSLADTTEQNSLYHVRIVASNANYNYKRGAGSLISNKFVLTSAQLVFNYTHWSLELLTLDHIDAIEAKYSPLFDPETLNNDIALVRIPDGSNHITLALPKISLVPANLFLPLFNEQIRVIGDSTECGTTQLEPVLGEDFLRLMDARFCHLFNNETDYPLTFCTMGSGNGKDYCLAEVGSGATAVYYNEEILVGITSQRSNDVLTSFTRVSRFVDWINEVCL